MTDFFNTHSLLQLETSLCPTGETPALPGRTPFFTLWSDSLWR
jgi:hypothetical protein